MSSERGSWDPSARDQIQRPARLCASLARSQKCPLCWHSGWHRAETAGMSGFKGLSFQAETVLTPIHEVHLLHYSGGPDSFLGVDPEIRTLWFPNSRYNPA